MLLGFQKPAVGENCETGNQAFSMRLRFLTIRDENFRFDAANSVLGPVKPTTLQCDEALNILKNPYIFSARVGQSDTSTLISLA